MAFEIASANPVVELGVTLSYPSGCFREQGRRPIAGSMEGHAAIGHVPTGSPRASGACTRSNLPPSAPASREGNVVVPGLVHG